MEDQTTLLIVDDEPGGREALEGVFLSQGYRLLLAENGQQAYDLAVEHTPDLVLLDVMMPNIDGFEVCRRMRGHPLLQEIPILIVTALDDRASRLKGIEAGADDFITKPFDRIELRARVRTITRLNRYRRLLLEKARFAWVVDQAGEGYVILDDAGRIQYANRAARTLLGLPSDQDSPLLTPFSQIVEKSFHIEPEAAWQRWSLSNEIQQDPVYLIQPESEVSQPVWLELKTLSLPGGSARNRLLRISEINEQVSSMLGRWNFHSFITHKLRTPVSTLTFGAEILAQHAGKLPAGEISAIAQGLVTSGKRIEKEINDILKFIHLPTIAQGQQAAAVSELLPAIYKAANELDVAHITMTVHPNTPQDGYLRLSPFALETIFTELLENSKKFHPRLEPVVEIDIRPKDADSIVISVKDDGMRLSPYQLAHAVTPYFQAEKFFTGEIEGMGLGLASVAALVWGCNGDFRLANREDRQGIVVELVLRCYEKGDSFKYSNAVPSYVE